MNPWAWTVQVWPHQATSILGPRPNVPPTLPQFQQGTPSPHAFSAQGLHGFPELLAQVVGAAPRPAFQHQVQQLVWPKQQPSWNQQQLANPSKLASINVISCNKGPTDTLCHACQLGHHVRLPFPSSNSSASRAFDLIHCDL